MELLKLSKFKLQLQSLVTDVKYLRERERSSTEQVHMLIQKQKQTEEEYGRKLQELEEVLASSNELCRKLERKVNYLQNDNVMLENKHMELKGTIQNLLQSRESFVNVYEESTCEMRRAIETRDRQLAILYERINSHLSLFDSIEKEAFSIKEVVDNAQCLVTEKEEVVAGLRSRMDEISAFEKTFVEKICDLENKLKSNEDEIRRKDKIVAELELQLEAAKVSTTFHTPGEELQKAISAKDMVIQSLISDKEALHFQVGSLGATLKKIQDTVANMNGEDKSSVLVQHLDLNCPTAHADTSEDPGKPEQYAMQSFQD
ncbi:hyaluronan mediated motility receptor isoform X2 [Tripterygium wilfordii]|uniref:hyaluronan mediated motility receptor isoform X2 n=1 Tax=Tripterygium wilfordii TaxID=458696 RepID=UPI0018F83599|nr:hyaluronan mediated motility receptor isoform X2 [Tripterygium wilfordii]